MSEQAVAAAGEDRETEEVRLLLRGHANFIRQRVKSFGSAAGKALAAGGFIEALAALGDTIDAVAELERAAKESHEKLRELLRMKMELGPTEIRTESATWTLRALPDLIEIADPKAVPDQFLLPQQPAPPREIDKKSVLAHLKAGASLNWARRITGRGFTIARSARTGR